MAPSRCLLWLADANRAYFCRFSLFFDILALTIVSTSKLFKVLKLKHFNWISFGPATFGHFGELRQNAWEQWKLAYYVALWIASVLFLVSIKLKWGAWTFSSDFSLQTPRPLTKCDSKPAPENEHNAAMQIQAVVARLPGYIWRLICILVTISKCEQGPSTGFAVITDDWAVTAHPNAPRLPTTHTHAHINTQNRYADTVVVNCLWFHHICHIVVIMSGICLGKFILVPRTSNRNNSPACISWKCCFSRIALWPFKVQFQVNITLR